jgi:hypothetical protein
MTLTGRAAQQHPDVDTLAPVTIAVATHSITPDSYGDQQRQSTGAGRADVLGLVDPETGAYRSAANTISEADRRALKLRRNGRPRR